MRSVFPPYVSTRSSTAQTSVRLLVTILCLLNVTKSFGDVVLQESDSTVYILIDPNSFNDKTLKSVYESVFDLSVSKNKLQKLNFQDKENISLKMWDNYNFYDPDIASKISKINNQPSTRIQIGDSLLFPSLPAIPASYASTDYVQIVNFESEKPKIDVKRLMAISLQEASAANQVSPREAGMWALQFSSREEALLFMNSPKFRKLGVMDKCSIVENTPTQLSYMLRYDSMAATGSSTVTSDSVDMSFLNATDFGQLYVLDEFNDNKCTHGSYVMDVIKLTLAKHKIPATYSNIVPVPINFFDNRNKCITLLKRYYAQLPEGEFRKLKEQNIPKLVSLIKKCKSCLPEEYISSIFKYCYNTEKADVISTSFVIDSYTYDIVPRIPNKRTVELVASSTNDTFFNIEDRLDPSGVGLQLPKYEPLYTYFKNREDGGIIVAAKNSQGEIHGMTSVNGRGVTVLGRGDGWKGECIKETVLGTSFATPEISAQLYIFKAYLRHKGEYLHPLEIKKRLVLSSDLDSKFVGRVGSAGLPNFKKLMVFDRGYLVDRLGALTTLSAPAAANKPFVKINGSSNNVELGRDDPDTRRICGLQYVDGEFYIFFENELAWRKANVTEVSITLVSGGATITLNRDDFIQQFKQIVILKNQ